MVQAETTSTPSIELVEEATQALLDRAAEIETSEATYFEKSQQLAQYLGAHYREDGLTEIGFWAPELTAQVMRQKEIYLEVLTPIESIDFRQRQQISRFYRTRLNLVQQGEFFWGVISGMKAGTRDNAGSFYWLRYVDQQGILRTIRDVVPYSLPYGIFAPAEVYDIESLQKKRADLDYFAHTSASQLPEFFTNTDRHVDLTAIPRVPAPNNILQIHIGTATKEGTLEKLTQLYRRISDKLAHDEPLTPSEENFVSYDAVQLLPTEPTIEFRTDYSPESEFFIFISEAEDELTVELNKPNTQDWGYDVPLLGSSTTNPALLGSLRPDEVVDFIATLHNFSTGPIQVIYDLVYGHADNQSELLVNREYLKGPNMYGQDLNHQLPTVRAIFLEMQRRKLNTGCDGIRIDGGQDFRFFNPLSGVVEQDDAYLLAMSNVVQEIGDYKRLMFTIFEDGRPWPQDGWEEISTYRDLIDKMPESYQWGPLIFAHNTPTLKGFWERKWRRILEVMHIGSNWITGCANHDTVRRGNQVDLNQPIDWNLGDTLSDVLRNGYDNPATTLWVYGFSPGLPMDFINALAHAPWMFFRNTDERYGVKVVSEEFGFLDWQITPEIYDRVELFTRLKALGFTELEELQAFGRALQETMAEMEYDLVHVAEACQECLGEDTTACRVDRLKLLNHPEMVHFLKTLDVAQLKTFALSFMEDCFEACKVSYYEDRIDPIQTRFNRKLREFRHTRPWLGQNLIGTDRFDKCSEGDRTIFYGVRSNPNDGSQGIAMAAHMGGEPMKVRLGEWLGINLNQWEVAVASPGLDRDGNLDDLNSFELKDSEGLLLCFAPKRKR
ncbi:MAG: alpha-amylase [Cyanobacteria bacterium SID2]|nr:alpha-amylase [Cyanobacteria bacterium SID2]MBP0006328.1 alpha-amylase [Cyanobacteria bacterium SBC]